MRPWILIVIALCQIWCVCGTTYRMRHLKKCYLRKEVKTVWLHTSFKFDNTSYTYAQVSNFNLTSRSASCCPNRALSLSQDLFSVVVGLYWCMFFFSYVFLSGLSRLVNLKKWYILCFCFCFVIVIPRWRSRKDVECWMTDCMTAFGKAVQFAQFWHFWDVVFINQAV